MNAQLGQIYQEYYSDMNPQDFIQKVSAQTNNFQDMPAMANILFLGNPKGQENFLRKYDAYLTLKHIDIDKALKGGGGSGGRMENRQQEVSEISRSLKHLARELNIPVIALAQLSRASEDKMRTDNKPKLSDLRESGSLEQDADLVVLIHREGYYKRNDPTLENKATLIIAKQRQGPTDDVPVLFLRDITRFVDEAPGVEDPAEMQESQTQFS
jgi:replicative DNA helicase